MSVIGKTFKDHLGNLKKGLLDGQNSQYPTEPEPEKVSWDYAHIMDVLEKGLILLLNHYMS